MTEEAENEWYVEGNKYHRQIILVTVAVRVQMAMKGQRAGGGSVMVSEISTGTPPRSQYCDSESQKILLNPSLRIQHGCSLHHQK